MPETPDPRAETFTVGPSTFTAFPAIGARLASWDLRLAGGRQRSVIPWPGSAGVAPSSFGGIRGGNPILFPFSGRIFHDGVIGRWKAPDRRILPMPKHGFVRSGAFRVEDRTPTGFTALLEPSEADREAYPFDYAFRVAYRFEPLGFEVDLTLENRGEKPLPWSAGHHFFFTLPWIPGTTRGDYRVAARARKAFRHAADGRLDAVGKDADGARAELDVIDLAGENWNDVIFTRLRGNEVRFGPKHGEGDVVITIGEAPVPTADTALVLWSETPESPTVCVEPWMGPPNAPGTGKGLHHVNTGDTGRFRVRVEMG